MAIISHFTLLFLCFRTNMLFKLINYFTKKQNVCYNNTDYKIHGGIKMSEITIKSSSDIFTVYNTFVDKYIKDANGSFIKVYLYIVRHASTGSITLDRIAEDTGLIKSDVVSALKYWNKMNVISYSDGADGSFVSVNKLTSDPSNEVVSEDKIRPEYTGGGEMPMTASPKAKVIRDSVSSSYSAAGVIKTVQSDEKLAHLFALIQQILNKPLNSNDYKTIYSFIDHLKLPDQVIIVLLEYCVSISQTSMRYIEKVAYSWADAGITTPELAVKYIQKRTGEQATLSKYRNKFKIVGREFTDSEAAFIISWVNELRASEETILAAYEKSVLNTGKISMKYMDTIIRNESASSASTKSVAPSGVRKNGFRNYPDSYEVDDAEKKRIDRMMAQYGGNDDAVNK